MPTFSPPILRTARRPMVIASRGHITGTPARGGAAQSNATNVDARILTIIGPQPVESMAVVFGNFVAGTSVDGDNLNAITVRCAAELTQSGASVLTVPFSFSGREFVILDVNNSAVVSDFCEVYPDAGALIPIRTNVQVNSSELYPVVTLAARYSAAENFVESTGATVVYGNGAIAGTTGLGLCPLGIIGYTPRPQPSVFVCSDSIGHGGNVSASTQPTILGGYVGFIGEGLQNAPTNGSVIPAAWCSKTGATANDMVIQAFGTRVRRRWTMARYTTHGLFAIGRNDIGVLGLTLSQVQTAITALWTRSRSCGHHVTQVLLGPGTTGTFSTPGGQSYQTGFEVGGIRDQFNAWVPTQVGRGLLDDYINPWVDVEDIANPGKWLPNMTADGTHPTNAGHTAMAPYVNAWARRLTVPNILPIYY